ncbi:Glyco-trans-2-like domain-containing protein [Methylorubrum extorquens]
MLGAQTLSQKSFEVLVIDNNSKCTLERVREVVNNRAIVLLAEEQGAGPARNVGAAAARAPLLAFIDSDCRPAPDWLSRILKALQTHSIVGGRVITECEVPGHPSPVEAFEAVFAFRFDKYIRQKGFTGSGNMAVKKEVFEDVGGFRKAVSEDVDWSHRALAKNYKIVFDPSVVVGHPARRNWQELRKKFERLSREGYLLIKDKPRGRLKWFVRSFAVLLSPLVHVLRVLAAPELPRLADRLAAIRILFAIRTYRFFEMNRLLFMRRTL